MQEVYLLIREFPVGSFFIILGMLYTIRYIFSVLFQKKCDCQSHNSEDDEEDEG